MNGVPLVLLALLTAIIAMMFAVIRYAQGGEKMLCHLEPLSPDWHYRTRIRPRPDLKCWYLGPLMKPRAELYWAEAPSIPPINIMEEENEKPPFELRWKGE